MATRTLHSSAMVGAFVLAALALLMVGSLWIAGSTAITGKGNPYTVLLVDSGGVEAGSRVRVAGVAVGRVQRIVLRADPEWPVLVEVSMKPDVDIRADAQATISSQGLLGEKFLQILPGSPEAPAMPPGGQIPGQPPMDLTKAMARVDDIAERLTVLLDHATKMVSSTAGQVETLLDRANGLLDDENRENLRVMLASMRTTLEKAGPQLTSLITRLDSTAANLDTALADLPALTQRISGLVGSLDNALGADGERLAAVLDAATGGLHSAEDAMGLFTENRAEIDATLADLRDTVANLKAFSQKVRERPYSLVRVKNPPERKPGDGVGEDGR